MGGGYSIDGGLTFDSISDTISDGKSGNAWLVKGKTTLMDKVDVQGYFARRGDNFSTSTSLTDSAIKKYGARAGNQRP